MTHTILITGASKGIGLSMGLALNAAGHTVIGTSRAPSTDDRIPFKLIALDVTDDGSVTAAVEEALAELGQFDVLINNAGYDLYAAAEEAGISETVAQMETNFFGAVRMINAVLPHMRARGAGKIINIGSVGGYLGLPYNSAYAASKFALAGYSESLRLELRPFGISVVLVEPEAVATDTLDTSIRGVATPHPAYAERSAAMLEHMRAMGRQSKVTPEAVARTVADVVADPRPKLRYPVGALARSTPWLKLMPQRWFERFMVRQFG